MNILLAGHSIIDNIQGDISKTQKPGGVYYNATGLFYSSSKNDRLFLLTSVNQNKFHLFENIYKNYDISFSFETESLPEVFLTVNQNCEREEKYLNLGGNLFFPDSEALQNFDGIFINMITGFDFSVSEIVRLRKNYKGAIYLDVHTLARDIDGQKRRFFRETIPDRELWLSSADIIQVNENELKTLSLKKEEREIAQDVLSFGPACLIITKGDKGASIYFAENNEIRYAFASALKTDPVNSVGCGDIFGSIFFYNYIKEKDFVRSLRKANFGAGLVTSYDDVNEFYRLKDDLKKQYD